MSGETLKHGMMSDLELALWSFSQEEREMLMCYFQYYRQEYGDKQAQKKDIGQSVNRKLEDSSSYNPLPQIERDVISSNKIFIKSGRTHDIST